MRKLAMVLMVLVGGCLVSGCIATFDMGAASFDVQSIPAGMFSWTVDVPSFKSTASFDLGKTVGVLGDGVKAFVGMVSMR